MGSLLGLVGLGGGSGGGASSGSSASTSVSVTNTSGGGLNIWEIVLGAIALIVIGLLFTLHKK